MNLIQSVPSETIKEIHRKVAAQLSFKQAHTSDHYEYLIRWGSTQKSVNAYRTFNTADAIRNACNKKKSRELLQQAGIPVPSLSNTYPCIGRPEKHEKGENFFYCKDRWDKQAAKKQGAVYFSHVYPKQSEYRVHIGSGYVILMSEKIGDKRGKIKWNYEEGFRFRHLRHSDYRAEITSLAKQAIKALGLSFGAVDILADPKDLSLPLAVVCEVNTAPALSPYGIKKYSEYFERILSGRYD